MLDPLVNHPDDDDQPEPELCIYCNEAPADTSEHYPYCTAFCAIDAELDR